MNRSAHNAKVVPATIARWRCWWAAPRGGEWTPRGCNTGLPVASLCGVCWAPGISIAAVANHVLVRRASCLLMPRSTAQRPSEKACPSCQGEAPEKTGVSLRAD